MRGSLETLPVECCLLSVSSGAAPVLLRPQRVLRRIAETPTSRLVVHRRCALVTAGGPLVPDHCSVQRPLRPVLRLVGALVCCLQVTGTRRVPLGQPGQPLGDLLGAPAGRLGACRRSSTSVVWLHRARPRSDPVIRGKLSTSTVATPGAPTLRYGTGMCHRRVLADKPGIRSGDDDIGRTCHRCPMEESVAGSGPADLSSDEQAWRRRLDESRATMDGLRQDTGRVSAAIAETERSVASTLRKLAAEDRKKGRTAAAERRDARAKDAERFAARERAEAASLNDQSAPGGAPG
jgi:hypothetical protein